MFGIDFQIKFHRLNWIMNPSRILIHESIFWNAGASHQALISSSCDCDTQALEGCSTFAWGQEIGGPATAATSPCTGNAGGIAPRISVTGTWFIFANAGNAPLYLYCDMLCFWEVDILSILYKSYMMIMMPTFLCLWHTLLQLCYSYIYVSMRRYLDNMIESMPKHFANLNSVSSNLFLNMLQFELLKVVDEFRPALLKLLRRLRRLYAPGQGLLACCFLFPSGWVCLETFSVIWCFKASPLPIETLMDLFALF